MSDSHSGDAKYIFTCNSRSLLVHRLLFEEESRECLSSESLASGRMRSDPPRESLVKVPNMSWLGACCKKAPVRMTIIVTPTPGKAGVKYKQYIPCKKDAISG